MRVAKRQVRRERSDDAHELRLANVVCRNACRNGYGTRLRDQNRGGPKPEGQILRLEYATGTPDRTRVVVFVVVFAVVVFVKITNRLELIREPFQQLSARRQTKRGVRPQRQRHGLRRYAKKVSRFRRDCGFVKKARFYTGQ